MLTIMTKNENHHHWLAPKNYRLYLQQECNVPPAKRQAVNSAFDKSRFKKWIPKAGKEKLFERTSPTVLVRIATNNSTLAQKEVMYVTAWAP